MPLDDIDFSVQAPLSGVFYRMHNPQFAYAPISGMGAKMFGGRFNPEGKPALYLANDVLTAYEEAGDCGMTPGLVSPMTLVSYTVSLARVVDLRAYKPLFDQDWEVKAILYAENKGPAPNSWDAYSLAKALKAEGLLVPSYRRASGHNLVLLDWSSDTVKVHDPDGRLSKAYGGRFNLVSE